MVRGIYFCCEFLFTAVKVWFVLGLAGAVWERRVDARKYRIACAVSMVLTAGVNTYNNMIISVLFSKAFLVVIIFWISLVSCYLYDCRYRDSFCLEYLLWTMLALADLFIQALAYVLLDFAGLQRDILLEATVPRAVYQLLGAAFLLWAMKPMCQVVRQRRREVERCLRWVWLLVLPFFVCLMYFQRIYIAMISELFMYYWWCFLLGSLLTLVSCLAYMAVRHDRETSWILQHEMEAIENEYQIWQQDYEKIKVLQHDFSKHKQFIQDLIEEGREQEALGYLDEIDVTLKKDMNRNLVNHGMLNLVLNRKIREGEALGITVQYEMCDMSGLRLTSMEIVALIANILDNAIEANQKLAEGAERWMRLDCTRKGQMLVIIASNSRAGEKLKFSGEILRTTKTDKGAQHGLGMRSIRQIVEQYEGHMRIEAEENTFQLTLYLKGFA